MDLRYLGLVGMGVMGRNLVQNFLDHGFSAAVYDRDATLLTKFMDTAGEGRPVTACETPEAFCAALERPRRIMLMVTAGQAVDWCIESLLPHLDPGDVIIDGGNSHFKDTVRRAAALEEKGLAFIGSGVSGGEEGARRGPALMPGGTRAGWDAISKPFQAISAKTADGTPCCDYVGPGGAGHFVKMVHNGIEYGDMQLICEAYWLMREVLGMTPVEQKTIFADWNAGELNSYLIEITSHILGAIDPATHKPMVDVILDKAGQKGTGAWTSQIGLELGTPIPTIAEAVFARCLSAVKGEREIAAKALAGPAEEFAEDKGAFIEDIRQALYASKICSYAQGFQLMAQASKEYDWNLDFARIASLWRGGCIIRAVFLDRIREAYETDPNTPNLMLTPFFRDALAETQAAWRRVIATAVRLGVPAPAFSSALAYYDGYRSAVLPANLLQAQRDYFGAHTYERIDKAHGEHFHTEWPTS